MMSVASFVDTITPFTRDTIWDRFDKHRSDKIDCQKMLPKLIYSLILMYIKSHDRNANVPKLNLLLPLTQSISLHIKNQLNSEYITKHDFRDNIVIYLQQFAREIKPEWMAASYVGFYFNVAEMAQILSIELKSHIWDKSVYGDTADSPSQLKLIMLEIINEYKVKLYINFIYIYLFSSLPSNDKNKFYKQ